MRKVARLILALLLVCACSPVVSRPEAPPHPAPSPAPITPLPRPLSLDEARNDPDFEAAVERHRQGMDGGSRDGMFRPDKVIARAGIGPGTVAADIGAGSGYYSWRLADAGATVYAVDTDPLAVEYMLRMTRRHTEYRERVIPVLSLANNPGLPDGIADVALMSGVHYVNYLPDDGDRENPVGWLAEHRREFLENIRRCLKPGGLLVILEGSQETNPISALDETGFKFVVEGAGFDLIASYDDMENHYLMVFRSRSATGR